MAIDKMASLAVPQMSSRDLLRQHGVVQEIDQLARHRRWRAAQEMGSGRAPFACQFFKRNALSSKSTRLATRLPLLGAVARQDVGHPIVAFVTGNFVERPGRPVH